MTQVPGRYTLPLRPENAQTQRTAPREDVPGIGLPSQTPAPADDSQMIARPDAPTPNLELERYDRKWLNVPYARESPAQQLDLFLPDGRGSVHPLVILVHGGGFAMGDKQGAELAGILDPAIRHGYAVASVNYRLSGEDKFPAAVEDVKAAIRFLRAHATSFMLNPNRFAVWGFSAGGNLASLAAVTGRMTTFANGALGNPDVSGDIQAAVDFYGPIDFAMLDPQLTISGVTGQHHDSADSFESRYLGAPVPAVPWLVKESNPQTYLSQGIPPFFIAHGLRDATVPYQQSVLFSAYLNMYLPADRIALRLVDGAEHGGSAFFTEDFLSQVFAFLDNYLMLP